jgi:hypothetical protein
MERPMPENDAVNTEHLKWLVERRADVQHTLLALYEHVSRCSDQDDLIDDLIASAFSLWRAVFLAEIDRDWNSVNKGQRDFLAKVIADNAISYADDKSTRAWSVAYYLDNAKFRLDGPSQDLFGESPRLAFVHTAHGAASVTRNEWDCVHDYLRVLINKICQTSLELREPDKLPRFGHRGVRATEL